MLGDVNNFFVFKSLLTMPSNVLPLHLKQSFPAIISIFSEDEGDGIESRLPFKIFSTLIIMFKVLCVNNFVLSLPQLSSPPTTLFPFILFSFCFIQPQFGSMPHVMKFTRLTQQLASPLRPNFCFKVSGLFSSFLFSL